MYASKLIIIFIVVQVIVRSRYKTCQLLIFSQVTTSGYFYVEYGADALAI